MSRSQEIQEQIGILPLFGWEKGYKANSKVLVLKQTTVTPIIQNFRKHATAVKLPMGGCDNDTRRTFMTHPTGYKEPTQRNPQSKPNSPWAMSVFNNNKKMMRKAFKFKNLYSPEKAC